MTERKQLYEGLDQLARRIVSRGLTVPALLVLESCLPLSFLGNQLLVFCHPLADLLGLAGPEYQTWLKLTEDRANLEALIIRLERQA